MEQSIVKTSNDLIVKNRQREFVLSDGALDYIRKKICPGANKQQEEVFIYQCMRLQLDPLTNQIYYIGRNVWNANSGTYEKVYTTQISIDGMRLISERNADYGGQTEPYYCDRNGVWTQSVWIPTATEKYPTACKIGVYRKSVPDRVFAWGVAHWESYKQEFKDKKTNTMCLAAMWEKMSPEMLSKCAEALALRKAFPNDLAGIYTNDEMEQAENDNAQLPSSTPTTPKPKPNTIEQTKHIPKVELKVLKNQAKFNGDIQEIKSAFWDFCILYPDQAKFAIPEIGNYMDTGTSLVNWIMANSNRIESVQKIFYTPELYSGRLNMDENDTDHISSDPVFAENEPAKAVKSKVKKPLLNSEDENGIPLDNQPEDAEFSEVQ